MIACPAIYLITTQSTHGCLTCLRNKLHHHFDLSAQQFRDALCLCYHHPLSLIPASCDGCGEDFSLTHVLDCRKGGLVTQRHNEVRDALGDLAALGYSEVVREPIVCDENGSPGFDC